MKFTFLHFVQLMYGTSALEINSIIQEFLSITDSNEEIYEPSVDVLFYKLTPTYLLMVGQHQAKSRKYQGVFEVKSRVKTWQVRGIWSQQLEHWQVPKWGTEPGVQKGKRSLLASHTRCKCSMETTHNSVKVKLGLKVMKLVESLIGREVTVGQGSECHLTFVRGLLHIAK